MFAQIEYPEILHPGELDKYLSIGWFRMRQTIFTTNFLFFNHHFYSAIWLRVKLNNSIHDKKYATLKKLNKGYLIEVKKAEVDGISAQHEMLYQYYRQSISFDVSQSLHELLYGNETVNRFNTYVVNIFDGDTIIAAGFFDLGEKSAAGITSIYHPGYKKYSLGKYLVYLKMDFCKQRDIQYFYPGYVVPGYTSFDYKLEIGKSTLQYLRLSTREWVPYTTLTPDLIPLEQMLEKLKEIQRFLSKVKIPNAIMYYKFFEVNLDPYYYGNDLFDFPVFLYCYPGVDSFFSNIIVFDISDTKYHLLQCSSVINVGFREHGNLIFDSDLLKVEQILFTSAIPEVIAAHLHELRIS